ncbi:MAG: hypothetical protein KJ725_04970 [Gammaproteobacteria bacterium]|uniref:hypothetical protein n=1 Tax=Methylotuvimicrobium sp. TaxID=2822413 RepID=UPI001DAA92F8|nr:hypothetical protein [Gammaproteobacteria bacterium]
MHSVEFETDTQGQFIEIPEEYQEFRSKHIKVLLTLDENNQQPAKQPTRRVSAMSLDTRGFKFNRDEANTR